MRIINFIFFVSLLPTFLCLTLSLSATLNNVELWKQFSVTCQNGTLAPTELLEARLQACLPFYGPGKKDPNCMYFCFAKSIGILNEDGISTWEIYEKFIAAVLPVEFQEGVTNYIKGCWDQYGSKIDLKDATCAMAGKFNHCNREFSKYVKC